MKAKDITARACNRLLQNKIDFLENLSSNTPLIGSRIIEGILEPIKTYPICKTEPVVSRMYHASIDLKI